MDPKSTELEPHLESSALNPVKTLCLGYVLSFHKIFQLTLMNYTP